MLLAAALSAILIPCDLPVVFETDFGDRERVGWTFTDPDAWRFIEVDGKPVLEQNAPSRYQPEVRSPLNIALTPAPPVGDLVFDVELRSTGRDYGHRDVCLFLGHRDPCHFYYVHLAKEADEHANSIFLVNGEPRVSIATTRTNGTAWDDQWHHVRIVRTVADGFISVYFDDMETPVMTARDQALTGPGRVGVGTFDDTAQFRKVTVRGRVAAD
jgi:hypothetical protein